MAPPLAALFCALALLLPLAGGLRAAEVRLKDLVSFDGVRGNDLVGYGLVVGLNGTGDGIRNAPFTEEIMANILERLGVNVSGEPFRPKNVAAVLVTAELPPFARVGGQIDLTVSAIGDATSLLGGTLVDTDALNAADGQIYAVAQGTVIAGGVSVEGEAASEVQGVPTSGVIPSGARVSPRGGVRLHPAVLAPAGAAQPRLHHRAADPGGDQPPLRPRRGADARFRDGAVRHLAHPGRLARGGAGRDREPARRAPRCRPWWWSTSARARS